MRQHGAFSGIPVPALAPLPIMGLSTWAWEWQRGSFTITEANLVDFADGMVSHGLRVAGYTYLAVDAYWAYPTRDASGNLVPYMGRFPSGMPALIAYVHGLGLKFGLHFMNGGYGSGAVAGPSNHGFEARDAELVASWGVDLVKYDLTAVPGQYPQIEADRMARALRGTGRDIVLTSGSGGASEAWWMTAIGAQSVRISGDAAPSWASIETGFSANANISQFGGPNHWLDLDHLQIGWEPGTVDPQPGVTDDEGRTNITLWSLQASPLYVSCDARASISPRPETLAILTNAEIIAIDQDVLGIVGLRVSSVAAGGATCEVWAKPLTGGACAIGFFNRDSSAHDITATFANVATVFPGYGGPWSTARDIWAATDLGPLSGSYTAVAVPAHGCAVLRVAP